VKEAKNTLLMLAGTAVLLIVIGLFLNPQSSPITLPSLTTKVTPAPENKIVRINDLDITVSLADTPAKRKQGLSGVESLGETEGMLFLFDKENQTSPFWMKDMAFAIDIIWINDGKVAEITENVQPPQAGTRDAELTLYAPNSPYNYVLEVAAGFSKQANITEGDAVVNLGF